MIGKGSRKIWKGGAMRTNVRWWLVATVLVMAVGVQVLAAQAAAPAIYYVRLQFGQDKQATVYLSFQNGRMQVGRTLAELESAQPIRANEINTDGEGTRYYFQSYGFPDIELPVTLAGYSKVKGAFRFHRSRSRSGILGMGRVRESNYGYGNVTLVHRDGSGVDWGYVVGVALFDSDDEGGQGNSKARPATATVPRVDGGKLTFTIETKMEGRKARIGLQVKAGTTEISNVLRNGKGAPVTLEVTDKTGKVVASEQGDPTKFGFT